MSQVHSPVVVALDFVSAREALALVDRLEPGSCRVKVGKALFVAAGPGLVRELNERGFDVFLDLKFHDIPNTVADAVAAACDLGVWMLDVHVAGGRAMLAAAAEAVARATSPPLLVGVTLLTSLSDEDLVEQGIARSATEQVNWAAALCAEQGLDGVVCSPLEVDGVRRGFGDKLLRVTPGIRPATAGGDDQVRVATPAEALAAGSNYLVIGRPITRAAEPRQVLREICATLGS